MQTLLVGNSLQVTISDVFDFDVARELVIYCKTRAQLPQTATVRLIIENVRTFNSCAIGAMLYMSELMPNGIQIELNKCSAEVHELFDSGELDKYLDKASASPVAAKLQCDSCFDKNCKVSTHECAQGPLPIVNFHQV